MGKDWPGLGGRTALVTGGARGIGHAVTRAFLQAGCRVVVLDCQRTTREAVEALRDEVAEAPEAFAYVTDVRDRRALEAVRDELTSLELRPDILVPNAGINLRMPALEVPPERVREILDTNLYGVISTVQVFAPMLLGRPGGRVVVTSSAAAIHGMVLRAPYAATKAALSGLVRCLALEWGPSGVTVNAVGPGIIRTPLTEEYMRRHPERTEAAVANTALRRIGAPEDVAGVVLFLASEAAGFITGQTIYVDGGLTAGSEWW